MSCAFHQNAPGHGLEDFFSLKVEVQKLTRAGILNFKNVGPNVKENPMPNHGSSSVNTIEFCPNEYRVLKVEEIRSSLVKLHIVLCAHGLFQHNHKMCGVCSISSRGCKDIRRDLQAVLDEGMIQVHRQRSPLELQEKDVNVIVPCFNFPESVEVTYHAKTTIKPVVVCPPGPMPYNSDKAVPYRYTATIIENGKEVEIQPLASVTNIADNSRITRSGRVFAPLVVLNRNAEKEPVVVVPVA